MFIWFSLSKPNVYIFSIPTCLLLLYFTDRHKLFDCFGMFACRWHLWYRYWIIMIRK